MRDPTTLRADVDRYAFFVIASVSFSMLMYQVLLTRISVLRLFFHFGFLVISNSLLVIGAAGTLVTLYQDAWRPKARLQIWRFCLLYLASLAVAYVFLLTFPIPSMMNLLEPADFVRFSVFNLVAAVPFFFSGAVVGMVLTFYAERVNPLYCSDLLGVGLGCLLCPLALQLFGAGGAFVTVSLAALLAVVFAAPGSHRRVSRIGGIVLGGGWAPPPAKSGRLVSRPRQGKPRVHRDLHREHERRDRVHPLERHQPHRSGSRGRRPSVHCFNNFSARSASSLKLWTLSPFAFSPWLVHG